MFLINRVLEKLRTIVQNMRFIWNFKNEYLITQY